MRGRGREGRQSQPGSRFERPSASSRSRCEPFRGLPGALGGTGSLPGCVVAWRPFLQREREYSDSRFRQWDGDGKVEKGWSPGMPPDLEGVKVCFAGSSRSSSFDVAGGRGRRAIGRAASTPCPTRHPRQPDASVGARTRAKSVSSGHSGDPGWVTWCEWTGAVGASKWEGGGRGTPGTFEGGRLDEERANGDVLGGGRGRKRRASIAASKRVRVHVGWIRKTGQKGRSGCEKGGRARVCWNEVDEKGTKKAAVKMHYNALLESPKDASPTILHA